MIHLDCYDEDADLWELSNLSRADLKAFAEFLSQRKGLSHRTRYKELRNLLLTTLEKHDSL